MEQNIKDIKEALKKRIDVLTPEELAKFQSTNAPGAASASSTDVTSKTELEAKLGLAEEKLKTAQTENVSLNSQINKLKTADSKVQAVKRALPHTDIDKMTVDQLYNQYDILLKDGYIKDTIAQVEDEMKKIQTRYHQLANAKLEQVTDALIESTKNSRKPQNQQSISVLIADWKKEGVTDIFEMIQKLSKLVTDALNFQPQEKADEVLKKFGIPQFPDKLKEQKPYNPLDSYYEAIGKKTPGGNQ